MTDNTFSGAEIFLAEEVATHEDYLANARGWQTWNGTEPVLQLLCLTSGQVLPDYAERPDIRTRFRHEPRLFNEGAFAGKGGFVSKSSAGFLD
jgi:hypothetical protein